MQLGNSTRCIVYNDPHIVFGLFLVNTLLCVSPTTGGAAGVGVRFGVDLGSTSSARGFDEGKTEDATPTVGQLSRHNLRVAAVRNCRELARCDRKNLGCQILNFELQFGIIPYR